MELNKKIFQIGLIAIIITITITLWFALYIRLDNPVFLKSYIEKEVPIDLDEYYDVLDLEIVYISNVYDKREIISIEMSDKENKEILLEGNATSNKIETYGIYNVNISHIEIDYSDITEDFNELEFNNVEITFNNGEKIKENLGRIILYPWYKNPVNYSKKIK